MIEHLASRVHVSVEEDQPLGTAGAIGILRPWIGGRNVLVLNADAWHPQPLDGFTRDWNGSRVRLLVVRDPARPDFDDGLRYAGAALLPREIARELRPEPSGLYEEVIEPALAAERLDFVRSSVPFFDCGTPADYLEANLAASNGANVVGEGARVEGRITRCVIWDGAVVRGDEHLVNAIRARDDITVFVEESPPVSRSSSEASGRRGAVRTATEEE